MSSPSRVVLLLYLIAGGINSSQFVGMTKYVKRMVCVETASRVGCDTSRGCVSPFLAVKPVETTLKQRKCGALSNKQGWSCLPLRMGGAHVTVERINMLVFFICIGMFSPTCVIHFVAGRIRQPFRQGGESVNQVLQKSGNGDASVSSWESTVWGCLAQGMVWGAAGGKTPADLSGAFPNSVSRGQVRVSSNMVMRVGRTGGPCRYW